MPSPVIDKDTLGFFAILVTIGGTITASLRWLLNMRKDVDVNTVKIVKIEEKIDEDAKDFREAIQGLSREIVKNSELTARIETKVDMIIGGKTKI